MEIIVKVTTGCNLRCSYCSEGDKPLQVLKKEYFYKLVDELPGLLDEQQDKNIVILWHGGEPMTAGVPYLRDLMMYARENLSGYHLQFEMQTNLTLLDEAWLDLFREFQVSIGVSVDGYKELHDANRRDKEGNPTYDLVRKNMQMLKKQGFNFGTLMVLNTAAPIDVDKLYDFIKKENLNIKIHSVFPSGRAAENHHTREIYDRYVEVMEALYAKGIQDMDYTGNIDPVDELVQAVLSGGTVRECSFNGTCGKNFLCLYASGEMGFCGRAESEVFQLGYGHITRQSLREIYHSAHADIIRSRQAFLQKHCCQNCEDWQLCHGGCAFEVLNAYGTLEAKYPNCGARRRLIAYLKTTGLELLKKRLIDERKKYRLVIRDRKQMLRELENE